MTDPQPTETQVIDFPVRVYTRWHQMAIPMGLVLAIVFALGSINLDMTEPFVLVGGMLVALLLPALIAGLGFPTRDTMKFTEEGLVFERRKPVLFAQLRSWGAEDYLKLVRASGPTLIVVARGAPGRKGLHAAFEAALAAWQAGQTAGAPAPQRSQFYGSPRAQALGVVVIAAGLFIVVMALMFRQPKYHFIFPGIMAMVFGVRLLVGNHPGQASK